MAQRINPTTIHTITQDGECHLFIKLDLNITLNTDGTLRTMDEAASQSHAKSSHKFFDDDDIQLAIPDFQSGVNLDFGKDVKV